MKASISATAATGLSIASVTLQYAPTGTQTWKTLTSSPVSGGSANLSYGSFPIPPSGNPDGEYDVRAVATDTNGQVGYSAIVHVILASASIFGDTYVGLQYPGSDVSGSVSLTAAPAVETGATPDTVTFQIAAAGTGQWTTIATVAQAVDGAGNPIFDSAGAPEYTASLDTTKTLPGGTKLYPDGRYAARVLAQDSFSDVYIGDVITLLVDNTPPTVTLANPAGVLSGVVTLSATAADSGSGVASVRFEESPSGSANWSPIGLATGVPYTQAFDTRGLVSGLYDLRAVATDLAGNVAISVVNGISISNPSAPANPDNLAVTNYVVPATGLAAGAGISLLGEIAGSSDHETWALGYTTAPPAVVDGSPLPYTATPGSQQLVLLRYTDVGGWQIDDVLRKADGNAFTLPANTVDVLGQMTADGEAWIVTAQPGAAELFHRAPGGRFLLDPAATAAVAPIFTDVVLSSPPHMSLGQSADGTLYGVLINPGQRQQTILLGNGVAIQEAISYATLGGGSWSLATAQLPAAYVPAPGDRVSLTAISPTGPGLGWATLGVVPQTAGVPAPLLLASINGTSWSFVASTGLDALDLTGRFAIGSPLWLAPSAVRAATDGVWLDVRFGNLGPDSSVIALYDPVAGRVVASWCTADVMARSAGCGEPLDANHPAAVPDAVFDTPQGPIGIALGDGFLDIYAYGVWTAVAAPGFQPLRVGSAALFTGPHDGWLAGTNAVGQITAQPPPSPLASWPEANQATLVSVALTPAGAGTGTPGALAVGLDGAALHYDPAAGWLVDPVPVRAQAANLLGVAFRGPSDAVAVGSFGTILDWNGTSWSEDPQSTVLTQSQLDAVAFGADGQGWAVGGFGTILHFDGTSWSVEQVDAADSGRELTSVAVAGSQVFAVAAGNLITRLPNGTWVPVDPSQLPANVPSGAFKLVSGLPDGGLVAAGRSLLLIRPDAASRFAYSPQPIEGVPVALAAFRDPISRQVRTFVSVAPPAITQFGSTDVAGFPAGDGELLLQTDVGWEDISRSQYPLSGAPGTTPGDGAPQPDPVLAVATAPDGSAAWAVGGYAGTQTASGLGSGDPLQARPASWQTSSIWRFDVGGSAAAPTLAQATVSLPAQPGTVSFAFFSSPLCNVQCSQVQGAQPLVNLQAAMAEIAAFAQQPGGPAFAVEGGNAVGPIDSNAWASGSGAVDLANLPSILLGLDGLPLYAAYGPLDAVPTSTDPAQPWGSAFAQSPAPFGLGALPPGVTQVSFGGGNGSVHHYYSYEVSQNGGTLFVIVLDNSAGSLEASDPGQTTWLAGQLAAAAGLPIIVFAAEPLDISRVGAASDGDQVAAMLAGAGVLAVFTTAGSDYSAQTNAVSLVPYSQVSLPGGLTIPEYQGATLGYQQTQNNGVLWYEVSVDTLARSVTVQGIPVVQSLALEPLSGLTAARSSTLLFRAVGRRPPGTLAATPTTTSPQGYANYVAIPSSNCSGCIGPSYTFSSSNPAIGDFVLPSGPGSLFPALDFEGRPIHSSTSGLFCAYNAGTTTVSVTSGLLTSSLPVTVQPGDIGQPCGTVFYAPAAHIETIPGLVITSRAPLPPTVAPPPPAASQAASSPPPPIAPPPPPAPAPLVGPAPAPSLPRPTPPPSASPAAFPSPVPVQTAGAGLSPVILPLITPPVTPVPPGGATAQAPSTARREEKARKHASQSAYVIRPAGTSATDWYYPAVGLAGALGIFLAFLGLSIRPGPRAVLLELRAIDHRHRRQEGP